MSNILKFIMIRIALQFKLKLHLLRRLLRCLAAGGGRLLRLPLVLSLLGRLSAGGGSLVRLPLVLSLVGRLPAGGGRHLLVLEKMTRTTCDKAVMFIHTLVSHVTISVQQLLYLLRGGVLFPVSLLPAVLCLGGAYYS